MVRFRRRFPGNNGFMAFYGVFIERSKLNHTGARVMARACIKGCRRSIKRGYASYFLSQKRTKTPSQTLKKGVSRGAAYACQVKTLPRPDNTHRAHNTRLPRGRQRTHYGHKSTGLPTAKVQGHPRAPAPGGGPGQTVSK